MRNIVSIYILLIAFLAGCTSGQQMQTSIAYKPLPLLYEGKTDTSYRRISRADFLNDTLLLQLIDSALVYNSDLQMAFQKIEMSKASLLYQKGKLSPELNFGLAGGVRRFGLYTMDGAGNSTTDITPNQRVPINLPDLNLGFQANWEIDFRGKLANQKNAAYQKMLASEEGLKYIQTNLVVEIASGYYELVALDKELDIIKETVVKQNEALEYVKAQKEAGKANELAVLQFSGQLYTLSILEQEVQQQMVRTENKLNYLAGRFPRAVNRSSQTLYRQSPVLQKGLPSDLLKNRPDIRSAALLVSAAKLDLRAANAAFLPGFTIVSGIGFQAFNPTYLFRIPESIAFNLIGGLVAPVVNKTAIQANFNLAKSAEIEALANYQQKIINGFVEVVNEYAEVENLNKIDTIAAKKNSDNQLAVESALALYKSARVPYLDVIISQQNALQSSIERINIAKRKKIAALNLYKSLGGGWG